MKQVSRQRYARFFAFLGALGVFVFIAHLAWSLFLVEFIRLNTTERIPQLPMIKDIGDRSSMAMAYFNEKKLSVPNMKTAVLLGSSFSFGYDVAQSKIYSATLKNDLAAQGYNLINMGIMSGIPREFVELVLCGFEQSNKKIDLLIIEIPIVNQNGSYQKLPEESMSVSGIENRRPCSETLKIAKDYRQYFFDRPYGTSWVHILYERFHFSTKNYPVALRPLRSDWMPNKAMYKKIRTGLMQERHDIVRYFKPVSDNLVIFQTPIYVDGMAKLGFSRDNIMRQLKDGISFCKSYKDITCIDTSSLAGKADIYRDVAHLSVDGHAFFAQWLEERLGPVLLRP